MPDDRLILSRFLLDHVRRDLAHSDRMMARCDLLLVDAATRVADSKRKLATIITVPLKAVPE